VRVAVIGSRGMPGVPGGIERHVEELYPRLAALGVDVTVYARREYVPEDCVIDGVRVVTLPSVGGRYGEALSHTARSVLHASRAGFDLLHMHAIGPGVLIPEARLLGLRPTVLTFHSFDYRRSKWGPGASAFLRACEVISIRSADALIAVSQAGAEHIRRTYHRPVVHIPNGPGRLERRPPGELLGALGLEARGYILSVGRLSPEKCLEDVIAAARRGLPGVPLVLVGDTSFTDDYIARLRAMAGPEVIFPGFLQGADLEELYTSALAYVIASEIEGLSLSLLEAMALGCPIVASDIPGNREGLGDPPAGLTFPVHDVSALAGLLGRLAGDEALRHDLAEAATARVRAHFDWDAIAAATLDVYRRVLTGPAARRPLRPGATGRARRGAASLTSSGPVA
jgi:glycosyltransferase involved in cell wall biosynthesis